MTVKCMTTTAPRQAKSTQKRAAAADLMKLRVRMLYAGITVNDIAAGLGVHRTLVSHALQGRRKDALRRVKKFLDQRRDDDNG